MKPMFAILLALFSSSTLAATEVHVTPLDLAAFVHLVKPERTTLVLDGRGGDFRPGPALQMMGMDTQTFDVNMNLGGRLVDLQFNQIRAESFNFRFEGDRGIFEIALGDQPKAIRSRLGAISLKNVVLRAYLSFSSRGPVRLTYEHGEIVGDLTGSGLLKPKWVVEKIKKIALNVLEGQVLRQIARDRMQDGISKGLINWAHVSEDPRVTEIVPGSVQISSAGLRYVAE